MIFKNEVDIFIYTLKIIIISIIIIIYLCQKLLTLSIVEDEDMEALP
jgi:hypothetical protein